MRVLWAIKTLGPGGAEKLLCAQARVRNRDTFLVECVYVNPHLDHLVDELESAGVRTTCVSRGKRDLLWPLRLGAMIRNGNWDVVHVHSPLPASVVRLAALTMPRNQRPAIVSTEHNQWRTFRPLTRFAHMVTSLLDSATIAVSEEVARSVIGPVRSRVHVLRHGIDIDAISAERYDRSAIRAEFGIGPNEFVVVMTASFRPQKDYPNLLQAAKIVSDRGIPVRFVAIGQGPEERAVRRLRTDLGLSHTVVLAGYRDDAVRVMGACDAFVMASQWEGLPVAAMEACALGLPIVATKVGGIAEQFADQETALLVPAQNSAALASAIQRVYEDRQLWAKLASASYASAVRFDVRRTQTFLEDLYQKIGRSRPNGERLVRAVPTSSVAAPAPGINVRIARSYDIGDMIDICRIAEGATGNHQFEEMFWTKHRNNPFGESMMLVATHDGRTVGVATWQRWDFERGDSLVRAARLENWAIGSDVQSTSLRQNIHAALEGEGRTLLAAEGIDFMFHSSETGRRAEGLSAQWRDLGRVPVALRIMRPDSVPRLWALRARSSVHHVPITVGSAIAESLDNVAALLERDRVVRSNIIDSRSLRTHATIGFLQWRYGDPVLGARLITHGAGAVIVAGRRRGDALECVVLESLALSPLDVDRAVAEAARDMGADHVIRVGEGCVSTGFIPLPGLGPHLSWRPVGTRSCPPLANWDVSLGTLVSP